MEYFTYQEGRYIKMAECKRHESIIIDEETKKIRRTQEEKFKGKLNENDTKCLLLLNNGDPDAALKDICEGSIKDIKEKIEGTAEEVKLKKEAVLKALSEKTATGYVVREYACRECDRVWWAWSPARKQVSTCRKCQVKYDPVPEDKEFGWAVYHCFCGNNFNGYGQMTTYGKCYKGNKGGCGRTILPTKILPPDRKGIPKPNPAANGSNETDTTTSGPTQNENNDDVLQSQDKKNRRAKSKRAKYNEREELNKDMGKPIDTGCLSNTVNIGNKFRTGINIGHDLDKMPWPRGKQGKSSKKSPIETREIAAGKKKVWYASTPHVSTGSTVADFLTQDDNMSMTSSYIAKLQTIRE